MMTHFRKRFNAQDIKDIDQLLHTATHKKQVAPKDDSGDDPPNKGALIVDTSCVPADIHYPTNLGLLNKAREKTEEIINILWSHYSNSEEKGKSRTYHEDGRKHFFAIILCQSTQTKSTVTKRIVISVKNTAYD